MTATCSECGALLVEVGACIDHFHAMLLLEHDVAADAVAVAGGRGEVGHFYAVSSYVLQHPDSMNYTAEALGDLRRTIADHLDGRLTLAALRPQIRRAADGPTRITRRAADKVPHWPVNTWPITVADVVAGGAEGYCDRVAGWAASIIRTLDEAAA
jgi:hypothetical protein